MKTAIIAIGTEITDGQIVNTNSSYLANVLTEESLEVCLHLAVPDQKELIIDALNFCSKTCQLIFVTGGLGPTSDDFTREVIAQWSHKELIFYKPSWDWIVNRCQHIGIQLTDSQKQQCFYPQEAIVIENQKGTADAFYMDFEDKKIWVLPGPPHEIKHLWETTIRSQINQLTPIRTPSMLLKWQCMGLSESILGEMVEDTLKGSGLKIGYRAHFPYVEVKVWADNQSQNLIKLLEEKIKPWLLVDKNQDLAQLFCQYLPAEHVKIIDYLTQGYLSERIKPYWQDLNIDLVTHSYIKEFSYSELENLLSSSLDFCLILSKSKIENNWYVGVKSGEICSIQVLTAENKENQFFTRNPAYVCEKALHIWYHFFNNQFQTGSES